MTAKWVLKGHGSVSSSSLVTRIALDYGRGDLSRGAIVTFTAPEHDIQAVRVPIYYSQSGGAMKIGLTITTEAEPLVVIYETEYNFPNGTTTGRWYVNEPVFNIPEGTLVAGTRYRFRFFNGEYRNSAFEVGISQVAEVQDPATLLQRSAFQNTDQDLWELTWYWLQDIPEPTPIEKTEEYFAVKAPVSTNYDLSSLEVSAGSWVGQNFVTDKPLTAISVFLSDDSNQTHKIRLRESSGGNILYEGDLVRGIRAFGSETYLEYCRQVHVLPEQVPAGNYFLEVEAGSVATNVGYVDGSATDGWSYEEPGDVVNPQRYLGITCYHPGSSMWVKQELSTTSSTGSTFPAWSDGQVGELEFTAPDYHIGGFAVWLIVNENAGYDWKISIAKTGTPHVTGWNLVSAPDSSQPSGITKLHQRLYGLPEGFFTTGERYTLRYEALDANGSSVLTSSNPKDLNQGTTYNGTNNSVPFWSWYASPDVKNPSPSSYVSKRWDGSVWKNVTFKRWDGTQWVTATNFEVTH